jgi:hypothetical protein
MATDPGAPQPTPPTPSSAPSQRAWRAVCPQCGANVSLRSAATPVAVCSYCRSTLARDGDALKRLGSSAELFDDHSPLHLGTTGVWQGKPFTLVGRLQWRTADAAWNEWVALFDMDTRAWLSEDNGRYVMAFEAALPSDADAAMADVRTSQTALRALRAEQSLQLAQVAWRVASVSEARIAAAEGELPFAPTLDVPTTVVDLRSYTGDMATLAADASSVAWSVGQGVQLDALQLRGLRDASDKIAAAQVAPCPSCGAALAIKLDTTKSITCQACKAIVDVSQGIGGQLAHAQQDVSVGGLAEPLIPLGATAMLALGGPQKPWQVVGYMVRRVDPEPGDDAEAPWTEYLLYSRDVGFAFLVHGEEGWSWAVPITGVPEPSGGGVRWQGRLYAMRYDYHAETLYVLGEFYWQVRKNQRSRNTDYASGDWRLNRESQDDAKEVTWSDGRILQARNLFTAFGLSPSRASQAADGLDTEPFGTFAFGWKQVLWLVMLLLFLALMMRSCSDRCDDIRRAYGAASVEHQQCLQRTSGSGGGRVGGGSWGGTGGGGGHK